MCLYSPFFLTIVVKVQKQHHLVSKILYLLCLKEDICFNDSLFKCFITELLWNCIFFLIFQKCPKKERKKNWAETVHVNSSFRFFCLHNKDQSFSQTWIINLNNQERSFLYNISILVLVFEPAHTLLLYRKAFLMTSCFKLIHLSCFTPWGGACWILWTLELMSPRKKNFFWILPCHDNGFVVNSCITDF